MGGLTAFLKTRAPSGSEARSAFLDQAELIGAWAAALVHDPGITGIVDVSFCCRFTSECHGTITGKMALLPAAALALPKVRAHPDVLLIDAISDNWTEVRPVSVDLENPFDVAAAAPASLFSVRLQQLTLPLRAVNVFKNARLVTVGDVFALGFDGLMNLRNFGVGSARAFAHALTAFINDGGLDTELGADSIGTSQSAALALEVHESLAIALTLADAATSSKVEFTGRFYDAFVGALSRMPPRDAFVLAGRLGHEVSPRTLDELGAALGVTRERARQLEKRAVNAIAEQDWFVALRQGLTDLLNEREEPLHLDLIAAEDPRFDNFQDNLELLQQIIILATSEAIHVWPLNGRLIASKLTLDDYLGVRQGILAHLESQLSTRLTAGETRLIIEAICAGSGAVELSSVACDSLEPYLHYSSDPNSTAHLVAVGRGLRPAVLSIFEETDRPLHFREVRERLIERGYEGTNDTSLRTAIRSAGMLLYGRSTYGTLRHLGLELNVIDELRDELVEIINSEPDHQWHAAELLEELQRRGIGSADGMDRYTIGAVLDGSSEVAFLGRLVWTAKQRPGLSPRDRRDVADLIEAVLVEAGRPLTKAELRQAIGRARGLNVHFLPQPTERVIRLGGGRWGLRDRDCRIADDACEATFRALESILFRRGRALHISELAGVLAERGLELSVDAVEELFGRAQVDPRFRVARGNYVALPGWDSLGRATMADAQEQLLRRLRAPMSLDQIHAAFEAITERSINRWHVAAWLNRSGVSYDLQADTWVLPDDVASSDPDE